MAARQASHWWSVVEQVSQSLNAPLVVAAGQTTQAPRLVMNTLPAHSSHRPALAVDDAKTVASATNVPVTQYGKDLFIHHLGYSLWFVSQCLRSRMN